MENNTSIRKGDADILLEDIGQFVALLGLAGKDYSNLSNVLVFNNTLYGIDPGTETYDNTKSIHTFFENDMVPLMKQRNTEYILPSFLQVMSTAKNRIKGKEQDLTGICGDLSFALGLYNEDEMSNNPSLSSSFKDAHLILTIGNYHKAKHFYDRIKEDEIARDYASVIDSRIVNLKT